jgi:hypothetical protein
MERYRLQLAEDGWAKSGFPCGCGCGCSYIDLTKTNTEREREREKNDIRRDRKEHQFNYKKNRTEENVRSGFPCGCGLFLHRPRKHKHREREREKNDIRHDRKEYQFNYTKNRTGGQCEKK